MLLDVPRSDHLPTTRIYSSMYATVHGSAETGDAKIHSFGPIYKPPELRSLLQTDAVCYNSIRLIATRPLEMRLGTSGFEQQKVKRSEGT